MTEELQLDVAGAGGLNVLNGMAPAPAGISEEEAYLARDELDDRWGVGQQLVAIGPPGHPKHEPATTKVLGRVGDGYRVAKYPGCASEHGKDGFIHNNAVSMWKPVGA